MMRTIGFLTSVIALLLISLPGFSQGAQGAIQGGVFDVTGGTIANAKVTITDVARGTERTLTTDDSGQFVAPNLTPGDYKVRAEATGFKTVERGDVSVQVGANTRVDLKLAPGDQTTIVTVTGEAPAIDTTSATLGGTVSSDAIVQLPLNGRNFFRLLELRPGVVSRPGDSSGSSSSNGRRLGADVLLVEGVTQFDMATSNNLINGSGKGSFADASNLLPLDAIQAFNTQQNAPAEYGWRDGSIVNVGIKSGTNSLHGTAYAFGRDAPATDGANYFTTTVNPATMEQFGATAGGPVLKNKVFWFAAYEGLRLYTADPSNTIVPSSVALTTPNPDLSLVDACNAVKAAGGAINPLSAQLAGLNAATCAISPASLTVENVFFYNPTQTTSYFFNTPQSKPLNNGMAKGDWNASERHHVSVFYYDSRSSPVNDGTLQPYWSSVSYGKTQEIAGAWTWIPNSTWVNDIRMGYAGSIGSQVAGDVNTIPADPYPIGYSLNTGQSRQYGGFPSVTFTTSAVASLGVGGRTGQRGPQGQFNFKDTVSYLRGNHAFKFGFEFVRVKFDNSSTQNTWGTIAFNTLTNFFAGTPVTSSSSIIYGNVLQFLRSKWFAGFVQDTWRITPRVTVTLGLRYEYQGPPHDVYNNLGTFDPTAVGGVVQVGPGLPHSSLYSAEKADFSPRLGVAWDIFGKGTTVLRAGFSRISSFPSITAIALATPFGATLYDANGNIVVNRMGTAAAQGFSTTLSNAPLNWSLAGPVFPISTTSPQCTVVVPCSTGAVDPNYKRPKTLLWNMDVQRAITNSLSLDIAYVGNHGYDETYSQDLNAPPVGTGYTPAIISACANTPLTSSANTIRIACAVNSGANFNARVAAITAAQTYNAAFPYYNYINRTTAGFFSNYNGLQVTLDQRAYRGLSFLAAYTYSHGLDMWTKSSANTQQVADPVGNFNAQYASSDQDVRHRFRISPTYDIPGKKAPAQMLEGWRVGLVVALQGRFPWGSIDKTTTDWVGTGENANSYSPSPNDGVQQYWNYIGPLSAFNTGKYGTLGNTSKIPCYGATSGCTPFASTPANIMSQCQTAAQAPYLGNATNMALALRALFANSCYIQNGGILTPPAYGTNGDSGRNSFRGPQYKNVDFTVSKTWRMAERYSAEFRTEFYNLFNSPTLANPTVDGISPSAANFGRITTTADGNNNIFGSGGPRHVQFGLKLTF